MHQQGLLPHRLAPSDEKHLGRERLSLEVSVGVLSSGSGARTCLAALSAHGVPPGGFLPPQYGSTFSCRGCVIPMLTSSGCRGAPWFHVLSSLVALDQF